MHIFINRRRTYLKDQHSSKLNKIEQEPFVNVWFGASLIFLEEHFSDKHERRTRLMPVFYYAGGEKRETDIIYV